MKHPIFGRLALVLLALLVANASAALTKKNGCYQIGTANALYEFADIVNGTGSYATAEPTACGELTANITVNSNVLNEDGTLATAPAGGFKVWTPIGKKASLSRDDKPFSGKFDGHGYEIRGLYYNDGTKMYSDDHRYIGLFGYISGGTSEAPVSISNVRVVDSYFDGSTYVGGLVARAKEFVDISNSSYKGVVMGNQYVGGLAGYGGTFIV